MSLACAQLTKTAIVIASTAAMALDTPCGVKGLHLKHRVFGFFKASAPKQEENSAPAPDVIAEKLKERAELISTARASVPRLVAMADKSKAGVSGAANAQHAQEQSKLVFLYKPPKDLLYQIDAETGRKHVAESKHEKLFCHKLQKIAIGPDLVDETESDTSYYFDPAWKDELMQEQSKKSSNWQGFDKAALMQIESMTTSTSNESVEFIAGSSADGFWSPNFQVEVKPICSSSTTLDVHQFWTFTNHTWELEYAYNEKCLPNMDMPRIRYGFMSASSPEKRMLEQMRQWQNYVVDNGLENIDVKVIQKRIDFVSSSSNGKILSEIPAEIDNPTFMTYERYNDHGHWPKAGAIYSISFAPEAPENEEITNTVLGYEFKEGASVIVRKDGFDKKYTLKLDKDRLAHGSTAPGSWHDSKSPDFCVSLKWVLELTTEASANSESCSVETAKSPEERTEVKEPKPLLRPDAELGEILEMRGSFEKDAATPGPEDEEFITVLQTALKNYVDWRDVAIQILSNCAGTGSDTLDDDFVRSITQVLLKKKEMA